MNEDIADSIASVFLPQLVQDIGRIKASVIAKLPCNHLKSLGHCSDDKLFLSSNCPAVVAQVLGKLHVNSSTSRNNRVVLHRTPDNHDGIMKGSLGLLHELLSTTTKDDCTRLSLGAAAEQVEPFSTNLLLLKGLTGSQGLVIHIVHC